MARHSVAPRLVGVLLLSASGVSTWAHRSIYQTARHSPAQLAEFALALATFLLASTGVLLMLHGARLFARCADDGRARTIRGLKRVDRSRRAGAGR